MAPLNDSAWGAAIGAPGEDIGGAVDAGLFYELSWDAGYPDPVFANGFE